MNIIDAQLNYWDTSMHFLQEVSCFITPEHGIISVTTGLVKETDKDLIKTEGCGGAVDFDWEKIWEILRKQDVKASKVIMLHTHPVGHSSMSSTDLNMVQGWRLALGVPIDFLIITQLNNCQDGDGIDGVVVAKYRVDRDKNKKMVVSGGMKKLVEIHTLDFAMIFEILYGMSKAPDLTQEDVYCIEKTLKESSLKVSGY